MLLAEALVLRSDQQKKLRELTTRIEENARVPEGASPEEEPSVLLEQASAVAADLTRLIRDINRTNAAIVGDPESGATISEMIAERDQAQRMTQLFRSAARAGTRSTGRRYWGSEREHATKAAVDVSALQEQADEWARRYRELDVRLQQVNWSTDLQR